MNYKIALLTVTSLLLSLSLLTAQHIDCQQSHHSREIVFPDIPGYVTLAGDFHIHSTFSDGRVWPSIRVEEAFKDNLDVIAMTEHLDHIPYLPHLRLADGTTPLPDGNHGGLDIDRNLSYEMASREADGTDLMVINGAEHSLSMPPGHVNYVFLEDVNKLMPMYDDPLGAYREAKQQGAFIFWAHPSWKRQISDGIARLDDMHKEPIEEGLIHGIEVVNQHRYSEEAVQIALDHNLTMLGNTDIHTLVDWEFNIAEGGHRPATLLFAEERTIEGVKDALMEGRTAVWHNHYLIGREEFLVPLMQESLLIKDATFYRRSSVINVDIYNQSSHRFLLKNKSGNSLYYGPDLFTLEPYETTRIHITNPDEDLKKITLTLEVLNAVIGPEENPEIILKSPVEGVSQRGF